ncbi:class I SAM-dependent methyltransferase [Streptomyces sioyaensis]|uniref:Class I SAM-dependent methyltransferase n=2 Tax=Streptomyces sioyaensis TaxID=67364 RepID=A0A4V1NQV4_9ACTN|nr:class I SAM-dependent methyltransferase [Streptomyces sioyaensis]RXS69629.1 class I SAM-dependent methyltransferase [Streptomyces sioyaensis]
MMQSATLAGAFDELADSYDHRHHEEIARALIAWVAPGAADAVADVACGAGAVARQLARSRPETAPPVLAVDLSPGMVAVGRARAAGLERATAIDWRVADAVPLPVADRSLDVVLCASSLHFLGRRAPADWRRALRPGGRVGFTLPLATHFRPSERFSGHLARDVPLPHTAREASVWAAECGFTDAASRVLVLGTRRVVVTSAREPGGR